MNLFRRKPTKNTYGEPEEPNFNIFLAMLALAGVAFVCFLLYVLLAPVFLESDPEYTIVPFGGDTPVAVQPTDTGVPATPIPVTAAPTPTPAPPGPDLPISSNTVLGLNAFARLSGISAEVSSVAYSADGSRLAAGSMDGSIRLWDATQIAPGIAEPIYTFQSASNRVLSIAFAPDGERLVAGGQDRLVRWWELSTGIELAPLNGPTAPVNAIAYGPNGRYVAAASDDGFVTVWDVATNPDQVALRLEGHTAFVTSVAFNPDGTLLAAGGADRSIRVWRVPSGEPVVVLTGHTAGVTSVAFSPDGRLLASTSPDHTVRLWNVEVGAASAVLTGHTQNVNDAAFSPDGTLLATAAGGIDDDTVRLWNVLTGSETRAPLFPGGLANAVAFSPDGRVLAVGGATYVTLYGASAQRLAQAQQDGDSSADAPAATTTFAPVSAPDTASADACVLTVRTVEANLRAGPDTAYAQAGALAVDQQVQANGWITGPDGFTWWRLDNGAWARGDLFVDLANPALPDACWQLPPVQDVGAPAPQAGTNPTITPTVGTVTACTVSALLADVNVRAGPGTGFEAQRQLALNEQVQANGWAFGPEGFVWWRLSAGGWVRADTVQWPPECQTLPAVQS